MNPEDCSCKNPEVQHPRELGVLLVVALTFVMMVVEIGVGYASHSLALLADGWHMATHVFALGITALAYAIARRFSAHRAFAFGTGKINALGGFTSSLLLAAVAVSMLVESLLRLLTPHPIDFDQSIPVAVVGLIVNLLSVGLLHRHDEHDEHGNHSEHDHGHRAAVLHVLADAFTSALAIVALVSGRQFGIVWLDPLTGALGGVVILKWSYDLTRLTGAELLDVTPNRDVEARIRAVLDRWHDVKLLDLHIWPLGRGRVSCVLCIESGNPRSVLEYRAEILAQVPFEHLTIELRPLSR